MPDEDTITSERTRFLSYDSNLWTPTPFEVRFTEFDPEIESLSFSNSLIVLESISFT
jgi:hypothetical protein